MTGNMIVNIIVFVIEGAACILTVAVVDVWAAYKDGKCTQSGNNCHCIAANGKSINLAGTFFY